MTILAVLEVAVVLTAVVQALRIVGKPAVRREIRENATLTLPLMVAASAVVGVLLWLALRWPGVRHGMTAALATLMVAAWWRARPSYGRTRRLPAGSLGIGQSLDAITDRRFYLDQAARFGPVFKMSQFGRPVACVVGLARARTLLSTHADSLAGASLPYNRLVPRGMLRYMPREAHKAVAPLFRATFAGLSLDRCESAVRLSYRQALARMATESTRDADGVRGRPHFERATLEALCHVFFGLRARRSPHR